MKTSTDPSGYIATAIFGLLLVARLTATADNQYWNPTTTAKAAGSNDWSTTVGAWAPTTAGTATPAPWVDGNNAFFTLNKGVNTAVVNQVSVNVLQFSQYSYGDGTYVFKPGTGPLTITGALTNTGATATFNCGIVLGADQPWYTERSIYLNGPVSGSGRLSKSGTGTLYLSNPGNALGGLEIQSGPMKASNGGNVLGGSTAGLLLGSPDQAATADVTLDATSSGVTEYSIGPVTNAGIVRLYMNTASTASTNSLAAGELIRSGQSTISLYPQRGLGANERLTFQGGAIASVNGMIAPWIVDVNTAKFVDYDGELKDVAFDGGVWDASKKIDNTGATNLAASANVHALKLSANVTVPAGVTLGNGSGGFIFNGGSLYGDGTVSVGTNELAAYVTGTRILAPVLSGTGGLTKFGDGALVISNMTYTGDTWINQGTLTVSPHSDAVYGHGINGLGEFIKDGATSLTLSGSTGTVGKLSLNGAGETSLQNTRLQTLSAMTAAAPLTISNSYLGTKGTITTGKGNDNIPIQIVGSGVSGQSTVLDCGNYGVLVGVDNGSGNTLLVDGKGVTGGAGVTGIADSGDTGFAVGRGTDSSSNRVVIANGGEIWDYEIDSNRNNGVGVGTRANGNRIEILGGNGFVSKIYKSYPHCIGSGSATGNVAVIDGKGFPGSAVWQVKNGTSLAVGSGGGFGNYACITNGGRFTNGSIIVGAGGSGNRLDIVGAGSEMVGNGSDSTFSLGTGIASSNVVYVADGGEIRNIYKWSTCIGGAGESVSGTAIGNRLIIGAGGSFLTANDSNIGRNKNADSSAVDNGVLVTGLGATWNFGSKALNVGVELNGSVAQGNYLVVENAGLVLGGSIKVGAMTDAVAGGASTGNRLTVTGGGEVRLISSATCGTVSGAAFSSGNRIAVSKGGILEANTLVVGAANDNAIAATAGGVFQFTSITPTITSLTPGDIAIDDGVISFRNSTTVNVLGNQSGSQLVNMSWSGSNAFRLNNASTTTGSSQNYVFDPAFGSTNYFRLEMVAGTTAYRGTAGNTLTIGQSLGSGGEMLCSNTAASVQMPFVLNGDLTLFNSTLTLQQAATINGDVFIDMDALPESGAALVAQGDLALGGDSVLHLSGAPVDGQVLMTCAGDLTGGFAVAGLPSNYTLKYDSDGTVSILHSPMVIVIR